MNIYIKITFDTVYIVLCNNLFSEYTMSIKPSGLKIKIGIGISIPCFPIHPAKAGLHFALRQTQ